jgi:hypothetical protein
MFDLDGNTETISDTYADTFAPTASQNLYIGAHVTASGFPDSAFSGNIDELRISSGALAANQLLNAPEPSSLALFAVGAISLLRRRRRLAT